ncbi:Dynamin [Penicillium waksmanii]|uniref:Dynamin n=1 Tax=Penicillium waksmanii TaxID=69791 RepID=UPI002547B26F|nr:Dynamin [Penicillium waksmanii]KAJ5987720.1 Dynamin [Penicillium waksmanii]
MASSRPQRTNTQRDYLALNYGYEDNVPIEDQYPDYPTQTTLFSDTLDTIQTTPDSILPSESASQTIIPDPDTSSCLSIVSQPSTRKRPRKTALSTQWLWGHFDIISIKRPWTTRAKKPMDTDRLIQCKKCNWETSDSVRSGSSKNIELHLYTQHTLSEPSSSSSDSVKQPSIVDSFNMKPKLSVVAQFQENILRWVVKEKMAFTTIESPSFRQIFIDLPHPELDSALFSRTTVKRRLEAEFQHQRTQLKIELASTCKIGLKRITRKLQPGSPYRNVSWAVIAMGRDRSRACGGGLKDHFSIRERRVTYTIKDVKVRENICRLVSLTLEENVQAAEHELERILEDESRQPIIYNHYYTDNIRNARIEVSKSLIENSVRDAIQNDWNGTLYLDNTEKDCVKLLSSLKKRVIVDMKEQACSEARTGLVAYYRVCFTWY